MKMEEEHSENTAFCNDAINYLISEECLEGSSENCTAVFNWRSQKLIQRYYWQYN